MQVLSFRKNKFWTHVTVGSYNKLVEKEVEKISEESTSVDCKILVFELA